MEIHVLKASHRIKSATLERIISEFALHHRIFVFSHTLDVLIYVLDKAYAFFFFIFYKNFKEKK